MGLCSKFISSSEDVAAADAIILPGVGAFGEAMESLTKLDLVEPLKDFAASGKPLLGICLGMQLLMTESNEFGRHAGLGILDGEVVRLEEAAETTPRLKVPQVGWNQIHAAVQPSPLAAAPGGPAPESGPWQETFLDGLQDGEFMYFVHSFYALPTDQNVVLSTTHYGPNAFCSSLRRGNVFACQFHPERSGPQGLRVYLNLAMSIKASKSDDN